MLELNLQEITAKLQVNEVQLHLIPARDANPKYMWTRVLRMG